jgi:hypothetical protein
MVFVIGTGRCGSTLVEEVLARHPAIGFITSYEDRLSALRLTGRATASLYRRLPQRMSTKGRARLYPSEGYRVLSAQVSPALARPIRDLVAEDATPWLASRTRAFFARHAQAQGKPIFLHKFTGWPRARFLAEVFPEAKFIHVVRDGRAVASSLLQMPWWEGWGGPERWTYGPLSSSARRAWEEHEHSFAVLAGLQWSLLIEAFEACRSDIGEERWLELRYEDLLEDPAQACAGRRGRRPSVARSRSTGSARPAARRSTPISVSSRSSAWTP